MKGYCLCVAIYRSAHLPILSYIAIKNNRPALCARAFHKELNPTLNNHELFRIYVYNEGVEMFEHINEDPLYLFEVIQKKLILTTSTIKKNYNE